jgi:hypothetical protein
MLAPNLLVGMLEAFVQIGIISLWGFMFSLQVRRLVRMAQLSQNLKEPWRKQIGRIWWWLGREEFWHGTYGDCLRCTQLTVMVFLFTLGTGWEPIW